HARDRSGGVRRCRGVVRGDPLLVRAHGHELPSDSRAAPPRCGLARLRRRADPLRAPSRRVGRRRVLFLARGAPLRAGATYGGRGRRLPRKRPRAPEEAWRRNRRRRACLGMVVMLARTLRTWYGDV